MVGRNFDDDVGSGEKMMRKRGIRHVMLASLLFALIGKSYIILLAMSFGNK